MHQPATPTCPQALSNGVSLPDFASFPHGASTDCGLRPQFVRGLGACEVHRVGLFSWVVWRRLRSALGAAR